MSDDGTERNDGSKTAKPFSDDPKDGDAPGMDESPVNRADAVGDEKKKAEMPKVTQREE